VKLVLGNVKLVLGVVVGLLVGPTAADAAERFAAPGATGVTCSKADPCSLPDAINGASANDEVLVAGGEYEVTGTPINVVYGGLQVDGDLGGPVPRIVAHLGGLPAIRINAAGAGLAYLEVVNEETEAVGVDCFGEATVERVRAIGVGEGAAGLRAFPGCLVRDSLLRGEGTNALGIESLAIAPGEPASDVRNVTSIATGANSVAVQSRYLGGEGGRHTLRLSNSIASGGAFDLRAEDSADGPGVIDVSNSNFDNVSQTAAATVSGPLNQTAPPLFVDAAAGDYREAPGSPTIDAGSSEGIGSLDLAGNPRLLGAAPDIGAFEFVPSPTQPSASLISLSISPRSFRPRAGGGAIVSRSRAKGHRGTTVRYTLTAAAAVGLVVERKVTGRSVGGRCVKRTAANRTRKSCPRYKPVKSSFTHQGASGPNSFTFSGRISGRALKPGKYRLAGHVGDSLKSVGFTILP
jgi:hypothetical protein